MVLPPPNAIHPKGESYTENQLVKKELFSIDTFSGRVHVEWDPQASVTSIGQMPFFTEFLKTAGLFDSWVTDCPLSYVSNNASKNRELLGTLL